MKKTVQAATFLSAVLILGSASAFARKDNRHRPDCPPPDVPFSGPECREIRNSDEEVLIGTVKSVDSKSMSIVLTDMDGKDLKIFVSPFTRILDCPKGRKPSDKPEPSMNFSLDDVGKNSWVIVSLFNTKSETPVARKIVLDKGSGANIK
ncbi:hypothetical protein [Treponema sp.]|uniref:hypothetical protein n=1 Tax=Treponema sp. TaxID=166 RepID=UPI003F0AE63E